MSRFGVMLRESAERERAEQERKQQRKRDAAAGAKAAQAHADALRNARRDLDRAIENVKSARERRSGVADADVAWRDAKARLIELETGAAPEWAPPAATGDDEPADADTATTPDDAATPDDTATTFDD